VFTGLPFDLKKRNKGALRNRVDAVFPDYCGYTPPPGDRETDFSGFHSEAHWCDEEYRAPVVSMTTGTFCTVVRMQQKWTKNYWAPLDSSKRVPYLSSKFILKSAFLTWHRLLEFPASSEFMFSLAI